MKTEYAILYMIKMTTVIKEIEPHILRQTGICDYRLRQH